MSRIMFFVDGFNLYHSLEDNKNYRKYKWLNLKKLCECFIKSNDTITGIKFFTAYANWKPESVIKHKLYLKALETVNIDIVHGKFSKKDKKCPLCKKTFVIHEEKRTDVNIAIALFENAMLDNYDIAYVVSADSDLIPSFTAAKKNFQSKEYGIIIPIGRPAYELKLIADDHKRIKQQQLITSQFPDIIKIGNNIKLERPLSWK